MLKKTITYTDFNDEKRTEDFYFNLTKAEILEMDFSTTGGLDQLIDKIMKTQDVPSLASLFKKIILKSYGEKSPDGRRFIKSEELSKEFEQTNAFSDLYMELATNAQAAADFINGIAPADIREQIKEESAKRVEAKPEA